VNGHSPRLHTTGDSFAMNANMFWINVTPKRFLCNLFHFKPLRTVTIGTTNKDTDLKKTKLS
jgi:hypothetical protein